MRSAKTTVNRLFAHKPSHACFIHDRQCRFQADCDGANLLCDCVNPRDAVSRSPVCNSLLPLTDSRASAMTTVSSVLTCQMRLKKEHAARCEHTDEVIEYIDGNMH